MPTLRSYLAVLWLASLPLGGATGAANARAETQRAAASADVDGDGNYSAELFDGRSLNGWIVTGCDAAVENGAIHLRSGDGFVRAVGRYADFVLSLEWKAQREHDYDSGIYIRSEPPTPGVKPWPDRYQINLREGDEGTLLGIAGAKSQGLVKPGEWNRFVITVIGDTAELEINGLPAWKARGLAPRDGVIGIQSEVDGGGQFEFREITIREIGFRSLTNGKDLTGWRPSAQSGHSGASGHKSAGRWVVNEGAITGSQDLPGNGGLLLTDEQFGDFEVAVEMANDFGPDSGLFLRSNESGQAYQYMVDYHGGGNLAGIYGEGLSGNLHVRNFSFIDAADKIREENASSKLPVTPDAWPQFWRHGAWNELRARIVGNPPRVTTWINGVEFVRFEDNESRHNPRGSIGLQVHGGGDYTKQFVRYRRVRVKDLSPTN